MKTLVSCFLALGLALCLTGSPWVSKASRPTATEAAERVPSPDSTGAEDRPLKVLAGPFVFKGSYYLKLSLENRGRRTVTLVNRGRPAFTPARLFTVLADGRKSDDHGGGAYSIGGEYGTEIPAKGKRFFGIALIAGQDQAELLDGYSTRFDLTAGDHRIEVRCVRATPAFLSVTIPGDLASSSDRVPAKSASPLRFALAARQVDQSVVELLIHVANESLDPWHYPYRSDSPPWHRYDWYQLELDGKVIEPHRDAPGHADSEGRCRIPPMGQWYAHTLMLVTKESSDRKFVPRRAAVYMLPAGEHTLRAVPSPLWAKEKTPVPAAGSIRIRLTSPARASSSRGPATP